MRTHETVTSPDTVSLTPGITSYEHNVLNQMTSANGTNFTYDDDGNMTAWTVDGVAYSASYDAENRMTSISGGGHSATFAYGPDGLAAKQVVDGVETRFVRAGYLILQERNASNEVQRSYVWDGVSPGGIGGLLEMTDATGSYSYLYDGKGNVAALIDVNQDVVAAYRYDSFGGLDSESLYNGFTGQPYMFSTKYYFPAFFLVKFQRRDLITPLGRWAERDPIGEAGGINLYGFVGNSAMNYVDPWGMKNLFELNLSFGAQGGFHIPGTGIGWEFDFGSDNENYLTGEKWVHQGGYVGFGRKGFKFAAGIERTAEGHTEPRQCNYYTGQPILDTGKTYNDVLRGKDFDPYFNIGRDNLLNTSLNAPISNDTIITLLGGKFALGIEVNINLSELLRRYYW